MVSLPPLASVSALPVRQQVREEKGDDVAPVATRARSYIDFPNVGCTLEAVEPGRIKELRKVLEDAGLLKHLKVKITDGPAPTIHFQHHRQEVESLTFKCPKVKPYFAGHFRTCFFNGRADRTYSQMFLSENPALKNQLTRGLVEKAKHHFQSIPAPSPVEFTFNPEATDEENLEAAYRKFQGLCIGEFHAQVNPKIFILDHMEKLRQLGVKTLFMEDFYYDTQQPLLDYYFETPDADIPFLLQTYLERYDSVYGFKPPYTYLDILRKAKRLGIRIVGIDTSVANNIQDSANTDKEDRAERLRTMNFVAQQIIAREKGDGKYLALMGTGHVATTALYRNGFLSSPTSLSPGMADLLQCPAITIEDGHDDRETPPKVNIADFKIVAFDNWIRKHVHLQLVRPKPQVQP